MSCRTITSKRIVPRSGPSPPKSYWQRPENILTRKTCRWCWRATARKSNRRRCCSGKSNSSTRKATGSSRVGSKAGQRLKYASAPQGGVAVSDVYSPCLLLSHTASASAGAGRRSDDGARDLADAQIPDRGKNLSGKDRRPQARGRASLRTTVFPRQVLSTVRYLRICKISRPVVGPPPGTC